MKRFSTVRLAVLGMMTALVFAGNFFRIIIPLSTGQTAFTLANIMCCLSGLLLGPIGGLAAGLGSALYDLTNPLYASECWLTFLTKGAMGLGAGLAMLPARRRSEMGYGRCLLGAGLGCAVYYVMLVGGLTFEAAALLLPLKVPASVVNAILAMAAAPPLCLAIRRALDRAHLPLE